MDGKCKLTQPQSNNGGLGWLYPIPSKHIFTFLHIGIIQNIERITILNTGIIQNYGKNNNLDDKYLSKDTIINIVKSIMGLEPLYVIIKDFQWKTSPSYSK